MSKLAYRSDKRESGYEELYGHACGTEQEMQSYCNSLDPEGEFFKIVPDDFHFGARIEPSPKTNELTGEEVKLQNTVNNTMVEMLSAALSEFDYLHSP